MTFNKNMERDIMLAKLKKERKEFEQWQKQTQLRNNRQKDSKNNKHKGY